MPLRRKRPQVQPQGSIDLLLSRGRIGCRSPLMQTPVGIPKADVEQTVSLKLTPNRWPGAVVTGGQQHLLHSMQEMVGEDRDEDMSLHAMFPLMVIGAHPQ